MTDFEVHPIGTAARLRSVPLDYDTSANLIAANDDFSADYRRKLYREANRARRVDIIILVAGAVVGAVVGLVLYFGGFQ